VREDAELVRCELGREQEPGPARGASRWMLMSGPTSGRMWSLEY